MSQLSASPRISSHPRWLRLTHWLNALAVLVMVTSGWRIYNASPIYDFSFPKSITLGGWLGAPCNGTSRRCGFSPSTA